MEKERWQPDNGAVWAKALVMSTRSVWEDVWILHVWDKGTPYGECTEWWVVTAHLILPCCWCLLELSLLRPQGAQAVPEG